FRFIVVFDRRPAGLLRQTWHAVRQQRTRRTRRTRKTIIPAVVPPAPPTLLRRCAPRAGQRGLGSIQGKLLWCKTLPRWGLTRWHKHFHMETCRLGQGPQHRSLKACSILGHRLYVIAVNAL